MKRSLRNLLCLASLAGWLAVSPPAEAQWTSAYPFVTVAASFNGFNSFDPNLELISNGVWVGYFNLPVTPSGDTNRFLFTTINFTNTWKENSQTDFIVPMADEADFNSGKDIVISNNPSGIYRFQFNETTRAYSVADVTPGSAAGELWINEIHYDNASNDSNEFIEVMGRSSLNLTNYQLILYNGGNGTAYNTLNLSGIVPNQANGFGTVAFNYAPNGIQNGDPDAVALVKRSPASVLWFISYDGSFTAADGPAAGLTSTDIVVGESSSSPWDFSLQLTGQSGDYPGFTWIGPTNRTPGQLNLGQGVATGQPAVSITFSNLTYSPLQVISSSTVHVDVDIYPILGATNIFATTFYRVTNTMNRFLPLPMSRTGTHYRTINPIPAQPPGYRIEYYIFAHYTGNGTNSPDVYPSTAPTTVPSYGVLRSPPGSVWVNEVNPSSDEWADPPPPPYTDPEFVEIVGRAGTDISNWKVSFYTVPDGLPDYSFTIPGPTVLANQTNGYGFYILGATNVPGVDIGWPSTNDVIGFTGGLKLFDEFGDQIYALCWTFQDGPMPSGWEAYEQIGYDDSISWPYSIGLTGTGSNYANFSWISGEGYSPNVINQNQTLTGGNTNNLPPLLICPDDIFLSCAGASIPTANVASVVATGYCGSGAVTVSLVSSLTNSGSGCFGSPKLVTRTYRAVSTCGTTSECQQIIWVEDTSPPALVTSTSALENAGFEVGDYSGWTTFGAGLSNITIGSYIPHSGFRHASLRGIASSTMLDSSGNLLNGLYFGQPTRGQVPNNAINGTAVRFSGTNQYAEVPYDGLLNGSSFAVSVWVKPVAWTNGERGLVSSRQFTISEVSGYHLQMSASNTVEFWTGDGVFWDIARGAALTNNQWMHIAGVVSNNGVTATKQLWLNGVLHQQRVITNYLPNSTQPLRVAAGATETTASDFYAGWLDDVRVYDEPLSAAQVASIYSTTGAVVVGTEAGFYRLNETNTAAGISTSGFHQVLAAVSGQTWTASAWALIPETDPLKGGNQSYLTLSYLNSTGAVLSTFTSRILNVSSPVTNFLRLSARGTAPSNTASARLSTVFRQDAVGSGGTVYFDDAVLSTLVVVMPSNTCATMPNVLSLVTVTDSCPGTVTVTQTPTNGAALSVTNAYVTFRATDACGLVTTTQVSLVVVDEYAPTMAQPIALVAGCTNSIPAPNPASISAIDNCGPAQVTWESDTNLGGEVCQATNPVRISRVYRATDQAGNFITATQSITVVDTNPPTMNCTLPPALSNNGFETGTFSSWNTFGVNKFVVNITPRTGTRHVLIKGSGGGENYTGFYQDLAARSGQTWRIAGYAMTPASNRISGASTCEIKMEFLGASGLLATHLTPLITSNLAAGVYTSFSTSAVAPANTTIARFTVVYIQRGGAAGEVFIDDASLSLNTISASGTSCQGVLPNLAPAITATDCGTVSITQTPPAGTLVNLGDTPVNLVALDGCGLSRTCTVVVTAVDDVCVSATPPPPTNVQVVAISLGTNITVRSLGTNSWTMLPEYTTNLMGQPQTWLPVTTFTNTHLNGTNITSFNPPVSNNAVLFRIWQKYP